MRNASSAYSIHVDTDANNSFHLFLGFFFWVRSPNKNFVAKKFLRAKLQIINHTRQRTCTLHITHTHTRRHIYAAVKRNSFDPGFFFGKKEMPMSPIFNSCHACRSITISRFTQFFLFLLLVKNNRK